MVAQNVQKKTHRKPPQHSLQASKSAAHFEFEFEFTSLKMCKVTHLQIGNELYSNGTIRKVHDGGGKGGWGS